MQNGLKVRFLEWIKKRTLPLLIFIGLSMLFLSYFLSHYWQEIFSKELTPNIVFQYISYGVLGSLLYSGIFTILLARSISFNRAPRIPKININNGFLMLIIVSILFVYAGFVQPKVYRKQLSLMYDVARTPPNEPLVRSSGLFDDTVATLDIWELIEFIKLNSKGREAKWELVKVIAWPVHALLFFILGPVIGILTKRWGWFWTILLNLFLTIPVWWYTMKYFEQLTAYGHISMILALVIPVFLFLIVCLTVLSSYKKALKSPK